MAAESSDNLVIHVILKNSPDSVSPAGTLPPLPPVASDSALDNPAEAVNAMANSIQPETGTNTSWTGALWNSTWGKWAILGTVATLLAAAIYAVVLHNSKSAATQEQELKQTISSTTPGLKAAGFSAQTITRAQNAVALEYGTPIALGKVVSPSSQNKTSFYAVGSNVPTDYTSLETVNTQAYIGSLSASPLPGEILKNSAAVHGLATTPQ